MTDYILTLPQKLEHIYHIHQACYKCTEPGASKGLGEHVSQLDTSIDKISNDFSREHLFSNKVTINLWLGSFMEDQV